MTTLTKGAMPSSSSAPIPEQVLRLQEELVRVRAHCEAYRQEVAEHNRRRSWLLSRAAVWLRQAREHGETYEQLTGEQADEEDEGVRRLQQAARAYGKAQIYDELARDVIKKLNVPAGQLPRSSEDMPSAELAAIRDRAAAATGGEWEVWDGTAVWAAGDPGQPVFIAAVLAPPPSSGLGGTQAANAAFIAAARADVRALLGQIQLLTGRLEVGATHSALTLQHVLRKLLAAETEAEELRAERDDFAERLLRISTMHHSLTQPDRCPRCVRDWGEEATEPHPCRTYRVAGGSLEAARDET